MPGRSLTIYTIFLVALLLGTARAQAEPRSLSRQSQKTSFSAQDRQDIDAYVSHWCERLASGDRDEIPAARDQLQEPVRLCSTSFRLAYADDVVPLLVPIVRDDNALAAVNALIVLGSLGTDRAMEAATDFCLPGSGANAEPRWYIRLHAVKAVGASMNAASVSPIKVNNALRDLRAAAALEDHGMVLQRELEAMIDVRGANASTARERFAEAFASVINRLKEADAPNPALLEAVASILPPLRDVYLHMNDLIERREFGKAMAKPLVTTFQMTIDHWEAGRGNEQTTETISTIVRASEQLLEQLIDPSVRPNQSPPNTMLEKAWADDNPDGFKTDMHKWRQVIDQRARTGPLDRLTPHETRRLGSSSGPGETRGDLIRLH